MCINPYSVIIRVSFVQIEANSFACFVVGQFSPNGDNMEWEQKRTNSYVTASGSGSTVQSCPRAEAH